MEKISIRQSKGTFKSQSVLIASQCCTMSQPKPKCPKIHNQHCKIAVSQRRQTYKYFHNVIRYAYYHAQAISTSNLTQGVSLNHSRISPNHLVVQSASLFLEVLEAATLILLGLLQFTFIGKLRSEEHTSELQSLTNLVCRLLLEKKKNKNNTTNLQNPTLNNNDEHCIY